MELIKYDIIFYTDAGKHVGLGHFSRCIKISKLLFKKEDNLKIAFSGDFNKKKLRTVWKELGKKIYFISKKHNNSSHIAFIDKMFDAYDPNKVNKTFINKINIISNQTILLSSGNKIPKISSNITCIGYTPTSDYKKGKNIYWGLEYAPTDNLSEFKNKSDSSDKVLIALGGISDNKAFIKSLIKAINKVEHIKVLTVLISPVNTVHNYSDISLRKDLSLNIVCNVANVNEYICSSGLVIASYGNLCYEVLSYKIHLLIVAQKKFQEDYAKILEKKGYAKYLTSIEENDVEKIAKKIKFYYETINIKKRKIIYTNGLERISEIIYKKLF